VAPEERRQNYGGYALAVAAEFRQEVPAVLVDTAPLRIAIDCRNVRCHRVLETTSARGAITERWLNSAVRAASVAVIAVRCSSERKKRILGS
jgi:hypothetical protein